MILLLFVLGLFGLLCHNGFKNINKDMVQRSARVESCTERRKCQEQEFRQWWEQEQQKKEKELKSFAYKIIAAGDAPYNDENQRELDRLTKIFWEGLESYEQDKIYSMVKDKLGLYSHY